MIESISLRWHKRFMEMAELVGSWSAIPDIKVGALFVRGDLSVLASGHNAIYVGGKLVEEGDTNLSKGSAIIHAESNAIISAMQIGVSLKGSVVYVTRPPCDNCTPLLKQAGVKAIVSKAQDAEYYATHDATQVLTRYIAVDIPYYELGYALNRIIPTIKGSGVAYRKVICVGDGNTVKGSL